jgi:hypothetical protein
MDNEPVLPSAITFSDEKIRDQETGKLTLVGVFHCIKTAKFPFTAPAFYATAFVTDIKGGIKQLPVSMNIEDSTGKVIASAAGHVAGSGLIAAGEVTEISFPLPPIVFNAAGRYKAVVLLDKKAIGSRGFEVTGTAPR